MFEASEEEGWFRDWSFMRRTGVLPKDGGLHDQDPRFVEACEVIEAEVQKLGEADSGGNRNQSNAQRKGPR